MNVLFIDPEINHEGYSSGLINAGLTVVFPRLPNGSFLSTVTAGLVENSCRLDHINLVICEQFIATPQGWNDEECGFGSRVGRVIIEKIRRWRPDLPVVVLSNIRDDNEETRLREFSRVFFRRKSETAPEQLVALVREILGLDT